VRRFILRVVNLFRRAAAEREMKREIDSHLRLLQEEFESRGLPREEAALAARRSYGGVEQAKELHREARSFTGAEQFVKDLRYGTRSLARSPGFTLTAVAALALGIGLNTTVFRLYDAIALKPLPVAGPDRVVRVKRWFQHRLAGDIQYNFAYPEYEYLWDHNTVFSGITAATYQVPVSAAMEGILDGQRVTGHAVSANYFAELGIKPLLGRTFLPDEDRLPGANPMIVLGYAFWEEKLHSDPGVLGRTLKLNGVAYTIIGIMPRRFTGTDLFPVSSAFWAPLSMVRQLDPGFESDWRTQWREPTRPRFQIIGRLKNGISRGEAQAEIDALVRGYLSQFRQEEPTTAITLQKTAYFRSTDDIRFQAASAGVLIVVSLILLAACANVANMLLARGAARQREIGIRLAVGAGRARIVRQLLTESMLLSLLAGMAGLLLSAIAGPPLWSMAASFLRDIRGGLTELDFGSDSRVVLYGMGLSLLTCACFGIAPALRSTRPNFCAAGSPRLRGALLGVQAAISVLLLTFCGTVVSNLFQSIRAYPGFESHDVYALFSIAEAPHLRERLEMLPELRSVATGRLPLSGTFTPPINTGQALERALATYTSDGYFETLGIRLLRGRGFTHSEADVQAPVAVISESTARHIWPGEDPIGKRFSLDLNFRNQFTEFEVVGISADARFASLSEVDPLHVYLPSASQGGLIVRTQGDRGKALAALSAAAPDIDVVNLEEGFVSIQRGVFQALSVLSGTLALLAVLLAGVGIYGVMAFVVTQRTKEIGIRMALGASSHGVTRNIVLQGLRPVFIGTAIGFVAAAALMAVERSTETFPEPLARAVFAHPELYAELVLMLVVAGLASIVPARRAARVDPMIALRYE